MEGIFFILIGAALFSQSWHVLGLYSEGRTMGVLVAALGLLTLGTIMFGASIDATLLTGKDALAQTTVLKSLIIVWVVYTIGVGAQGIWEFEDRAVGFYSAFLAAVSATAFLYFAVALEPVYSLGVWLTITGASLVLTVIAAITFFYLALQLNVLRLVAGWFILLGGSVVVALGLVMLAATAIR